MITIILIIATIWGASAMFYTVWRRRQTNGPVELTQAEKEINQQVKQIKRHSDNIEKILKNFTLEVK